MATLAPLTDANARVTPELFDAMVARGDLSHVHVELIDGTMVYQMPQGRLHLLAIGLLIEALSRRATERGLLLVTQGTIAMDENRPEPDVSLLDLDPRSTTRGPSGSDVLLAIEVAVTSLAYDRRRKVALYAGQRIPEYWIVNPVARQVEIYRDAQSGDYVSLRVAGEDESIDVLALPGHTVLVADLMPMLNPDDPLG